MIIIRKNEIVQLFWKQKKLKIKIKSKIRQWVRKNRLISSVEKGKKNTKRFKTNTTEVEKKEKIYKHICRFVLYEHHHANLINIRIDFFWCCANLICMWKAYVAKNYITLAQKLGILTFFLFCQIFLHSKFQQALK